MRRADWRMGMRGLGLAPALALWLALIHFETAPFEQDLAARAGAIVREKLGEAASAEAEGRDLRLNGLIFDEFGAGGRARRGRRPSRRAPGRRFAGAAAAAGAVFLARGMGRIGRDAFRRGSLARRAGDAGGGGERSLPRRAIRGRNDLCFRRAGRLRRRGRQGLARAGPSAIGGGAMARRRIGARRQGRDQRRLSRRPRLRRRERERQHNGAGPAAGAEFHFRRGERRQGRHPVGFCRLRIRSRRFARPGAPAFSGREDRGRPAARIRRAAAFRSRSRFRLAGADAIEKRQGCAGRSRGAPVRRRAAGDGCCWRRRRARAGAVGCP